jgi:hypothetical protein
MIDSATGQALNASLQSSNQSALLVANVILHGKSLGGNEVTSGEWAYPIDACYGCLVSCPPKADDPAVPGPDCLATDDNPTSGSCRVGLDGPTDCRFCRNSPVCACN